MKKISAIIIEDEEPGRMLIQRYIEDDPDIELTAVCENGFEGAKTINENKPDLIFLDIQMPKINGFELLEIIDHKPEIIFTTAYNEYAIKAFELNAIDYLLKPFSKARFNEALEKAKKRIASGKATDSVEKQLNKFPEAPLERVVVRNKSNIHVISTNNIKCIEAQDDYVMIYTDNKKLLKQQTMKFYDDHLDPSQFIRVHRSHIVNIKYIEKLEPFAKDSYVLILKGVDERIRISKSGYQKLKEVLNF